MHAKTFIEKLDDARVAALIAQAEQTTSGEIRVCVSSRHSVDALAAAQKRFHELGMARTALRNAVLIYFAPRAQTFAVWGDEGVHQRCEANYWSELALRMAPRLQAGLYAEAIEETVRDVGTMLTMHFPRELQDENMFPNRVIRD